MISKQVYKPYDCLSPFSFRVFCFAFFHSIFLNLKEGLDINPVNCADDCKNKKIKNTEFDLSYLKLIFERNIINSIKKLYFFDLELKKTPWYLNLWSILVKQRTASTNSC